MSNSQLPENKRLKILFLTPRYIYPVIGGDRLKPYNILKHLAAKYDVTLVSFYHGGNPPDEYIQEVEKLGVELFSVPLKPLTAGLRAVAFNINKPLEIGFYTQPAYDKVVRELVAGRDYDLAFSFFMRTAEYLKDLPIKKILMAEDCRTLYQKRSFETSSSIKQKIIRGWEYHRLKKYEPRIVDKFDITTLVTNHDIQAMQKRNSEARYRLLTNGTDINLFKPNDSVKRDGILFAGKFDVWANELMVKDIVDNIMPIVHKSKPEAIMNLVGADPTSSVIAMASDKVKLHANMPEMIPYLQKARVFLHPHNGGSGIQNKLLEAMACGCAVVTTPTGIQGIKAEHGKNVLVGRNSEELARHTIDLLQNDELALEISKNARKLIVDTHSWEAVYAATDKIIEELMSL